MEGLGMKWEQARILVTGGTGFVGSHLVKALVEKSATVFSTSGTLRPESYFFRQKLQEQVTLSNTDVCDFDEVLNMLTKFEIEYVFHLAAQPIVNTAFYNPRQTLNTNIMGTVNILEAARLYPKIKAVVVASSDKSYGKTDKNEYLETDPLNGTHPYEVSKSAADLIANTYAATYDLPVIITRFGNIYGQGDLSYSRIVPGLARSVVTSQPLEIRSDGTFVRDYLHVADVVSGYLAIIERSQACKGEVFNFGSTDTHSVLEVISIAEKALHTKINYVIKNDSKNEIPHQSLNFKKATRVLGWKPTHDLVTTLPAIVSDYRSLL